MTPERPEPCLHKSDCRSPMACAGWGYCRERNFGDDGVPSAAGQQKWRQEAARRKARAKQQ